MLRSARHVGRAVERDGDYFGPTLNRAARLMAVGHGGQVLLSEAAGALARSALPEGVALLDLGTHQLRDLTRPERIWQLQTGDTPAFPPLRSVGAVATNLPVVDDLVGREVDIVRVVELVRSHRLVTITGPGGVGKSSLALAVAQELAGDAADGAWLVELAPLADASGLVGAVAGVLPLPGMAASAAGLLDQIGPRQMLVILDNCEHLVDEVARVCVGDAHRVPRSARVVHEPGSARGRSGARLAAATTRRTVRGRVVRRASKVGAPRRR